MLTGYRVLDLCDEKGDLCGKILADLHADVIKIEPPEGSPSRNIGPFYNDDPNPEKSLFWFAFNASKRGITLNLNSEDGKQIFCELVKKADIVLESFEPGYLDKLGLSYSALASINPKIILTSITPFGQDGPYKNYKGPEMVVFALSGLMSDCGDPDRPPVQVTCPQSYIAASTYGAEGTMVALYERENSGMGQHVDVSAQATVTWFMSELIPFWTFLGQNITRAGGAITRYGGLRVPVVWECKDGFISYLIQAGLPGAERNIKMAKWLEEEGLSTEYIREKDWYKFDWSKMNKPELEEHFIKPLSKLFKRYTVNQLYEEALKRVISLFPVSTAKYLVEDNPQLKARNFWVPVHHEELNVDITYPGPFMLFSKTPLASPTQAPTLGKHNREIYIEELGLTSEKLVSLKTIGAI